MICLFLRKLELKKESRLADKLPIIGFYVFFYNGLPLVRAFKKVITSIGVFLKKLCTNVYKASTLSICTRLKKRLKISQLEKVRFIKVNKLKLTQVELF